MKIDLIIPTYKPDENFVDALAVMQAQSIPLNKVIVYNTEQKYFDRLSYTSTFLNEYKNLEVRHISRKEFDHGRTRNLAVERSDADFFIMMTQDAMPIGGEIVSTLLKAFEADPKVAVAYARQVAKEGASEIERYTRTFNYPMESCVRSEADIQSLGIKAFFCSNVCAMYRRDVYNELGGYENHVIFNEDMLYAAKAIKAGYRIAYVAEAKVLHSHNYSNKEYYKRNFDIGVSHARHPEVFEGLNTKGEGMKLVKMTASHLSHTGYSRLIPGLYITSAYKYLGYRKGKKFEKLSENAILKRTLNPWFWRAEDIVRSRSGINVHSGYGRSTEELEMRANPPVVAKDRSDETK